jgi:hypothetical protein
VEDDAAGQRSWLLNYQVREQAGLEFYFIIMAADAPAGTLRLYDFQEDSFSWGSWIVMPGAPRRVAHQSVALVYELGCGVLGFPQSHFEVRKANRSVCRFHQKYGAAITDEDELQYFFKITAENALKSKSGETVESLNLP